MDINQADPQSNAIHVAHNIPKDSDITIVQTNPFNTTVHISMNVGTGSKVQVYSTCFLILVSLKLSLQPIQVKVMMTNSRNLQLHVSFNGMGNR